MSTLVIADVIMDILGDEEMAEIIKNHYEDCGEQKSVQKAVKALNSKEDKHFDQVDSDKPDKRTTLTKFR